MIHDGVPQLADMVIAPRVRDNQIRGPRRNRPQRLIQVAHDHRDTDPAARHRHERTGSPEVGEVHAKPCGTRAHDGIEDVAFGTDVPHGDPGAIDTRVVEADRIRRWDHPGDRLMLCRTGDRNQSRGQHRRGKRTRVVRGLGTGRTQSARLAEDVLGNSVADADGPTKCDDHVMAFTSPGSESNWESTNGCTAGDTNPVRSMNSG